MSKTKNKKVEEIIEEAPIHTSLEPIKEELPEILKKHPLHISMKLEAELEWYFKEPAEDGHLYPAYSIPTPDATLVLMCMAAAKGQTFDAFIHSCIQQNITEKAAAASVEEMPEAPCEN